MLTSRDVERLHAMLRTSQLQPLKAALADLHPNEIADFLTDLEPEEQAVAFRLLDKTQAAETFAELDRDIRYELLHQFTDREKQGILEDLYVDDAVDWLEELPANVVTHLLTLTNPETRSELNRFLQYPEDSAGSVMTPEYMSLKQGITVKEAIRRIRTESHASETIDTLYVTDAHRVLEGVLSIRTLLTARDDQRVADIMKQDVVSVGTHDDQEDIVRIFKDYNFLSLPVVDSENRLVGIITVDDILDVAEEEVTEDFSRMALVDPSDEAYLKTGVLTHARSRITWLLILMISGMINGLILQRYEHAFVAVPLLVTFMPMLTDTGGNAGSQSSTIIIRNMALGYIHFRDIGKVIWREFRISLLVGAGLFAVNFARIFFFYEHQTGIALTVSLALIAIIVLSKLIGSVLPILAEKVGLDPALMAAPMITTLVDALGLVVYFHLAEVILHIG